MTWSKSTATTTTDADGTFVITVPVNEDGEHAADLTVTLTPDRALIVKWIPLTGTAPLADFQAWSG